MYDCVMKKAFRKLNLITKIYLKRSTDLSDYYGISNFNCASAYSKAISSLEPMITASEERTNDFPNPNTLANMQAMLEYTNNIGGTQGSANNLAQLRSCALIY